MINNGRFTKNAQTTTIFNVQLFKNLQTNLEKKTLWIEGTDEKIYRDYIERCKQIYNDFISSNPKISLKDEDNKAGRTLSMPLGRSARMKKIKSSLQLNKASLPSFSNNCEHKDYLADDK